MPPQQQQMFECLWGLLKTLAFLGAYNLNKVVLRQVHENEQQSNFTFGNGFAI